MDSLYPVIQRVMDRRLDTECLDESLYLELINRYGEDAVRAIYRAGRGYSKKYVFKNVHGGPTVVIYTYQGNSAEYIIFEKLGICSCRTRYRLDKQKGLVCYHLIGFAIDALNNSIREYVVEYDDPATILWDISEAADTDSTKYQGNDE